MELLSLALVVMTDGSQDNHPREGFGEGGEDRSEGWPAVAGGGRTTPRLRHG